MSKTWILVANRSNARLFTNYATDNARHELTLVRDIAHPEGHLKNGDFNTDRPGSAFDGGHGQHPMGKSQSPAEHEAEQFANELADMLKKGRAENEYLQLVLVAEPGFLGMLKGALDKQTAKIVSQTVPKDLAQTPDADIPDILLKHVQL